MLALQDVVVTLAATGEPFAILVDGHCELARYSHTFLPLDVLDIVGWIHYVCHNYFVFFNW